MTDDRPLTLRRLAARVATHPRIEQAVRGAIQAELPGVIEEMLGDMADHSGGTLRLYRRKHPASARRARDNRIRALLQSGEKPLLIAESVKCSLRHVYNVRQAWASSRPHAESEAPQEAIPPEVTEPVIAKVAP
jgi:hypothetical protein